MRDFNRLSIKWKKAITFSSASKLEHSKKIEATIPRKNQKMVREIDHMFSILNFHQ